MNQLFLFLGIAAAGNVVYHLSQKAMPAGSNPMIVLMAVYGVAFVLAAAASPFFAPESPKPWTAQVASWPVPALGLGVLMIEIGFLLAYRTGGAILQWSGVAVNAASAMVLVPIAKVAFDHPITMGRAAGMVLALAGMVLMSR